MKKAKATNSDFQIDPYNLEEEWTKQSTLYKQYADEYADARRELAEAQSALEVAKAKCKLAIRQNPGDFGLKKATNDSVEEAAALSESIQEAEQEVCDARHRVDVLGGAKEALDHKKKALGDLVSLYLSDYYSGPTASKGDRERIKQWREDQKTPKGVKQR